MIGNIIYNYLTGITEITNFYGSRIYPLTLPEENVKSTNVPFLVYQIMGYEPNYNNGVIIPDLFQIDVIFNTYCKKYSDIQTAFDLLNTNLHKLRGKFDQYTISRPTFTDGGEDYLDVVKLRSMSIVFSYWVKKTIQ